MFYEMHVLNAYTTGKPLRYGPVLLQNVCIVSVSKTPFTAGELRESIYWTDNS